MYAFFASERRQIESVRSSVVYSSHFQIKGGTSLFRIDEITLGFGYANTAEIERTEYFSFLRRQSKASYIRSTKHKTQFATVLLKIQLLLLQQSKSQAMASYKGSSCSRKYIRTLYSL